MNLLSCVRLFAISWTVAYQAPPPMGFSRQEYWSGLPLPSPDIVVAAAAAAKSLQSCPTLYDPIDGRQTQIHESLVSFSFSSVAQSCPTLCDPMNCSTPGLPVHHQLPEFTQTQVHRVSDAIQPSHPLSSPSPSAPNPSQHQSFPMSQLFT